MAGVLDSVNQHMQLIGQGRLELLLFHLDSNQPYGINVFEMKEVLQCPRLTVVLRSSLVVHEVANIRRGTIPIPDLTLVTGRRGSQNPTSGFTIIIERNIKVQGFLVRPAEHIVNVNREEIHPPPRGAGREHCLTTVTRMDKRLVEIIDMEEVLAEVALAFEGVPPGVMDTGIQSRAVTKRVLVADSSSAMCRQVTRYPEAVGVEMTVLNDGRQVLEYLRNMLAGGRCPEDELLMLISDIEMPEIDGYILTAEIHNGSHLQKLHIPLHTSLSGVFNQAMVRKVGTNDFPAKFHPDDLATRMVERTKAMDAGRATSPRQQCEYGRPAALRSPRAERLIRVSS